jgi:hypothetical protein
MSLETRQYYIKFLGFEIVRWNVGIGDTLEKISKNREEITKEVALKTLKNLQWKSDIKAFCWKPYVVIPVSVILFLISIFFNPLDPILYLGAYISTIVSGLFLGAGIKFWYLGFLREVSLAYENQSKDAANLIEEINSAENDEEVRKILSEKLRKEIVVIIIIGEKGFSSLENKLAEEANNQ